MGETFNDRLAVIDTDQARAHSAKNAPEYAKCAKCGESIELFVDLRNEFPDSHLYWAHVGLIPNHVVSVDYDEPTVAEVFAGLVEYGERSERIEKTEAALEGLNEAEKMIDDGRGNDAADLVIAAIEALTPEARAAFLKKIGIDI